MNGSNNNSSVRSAGADPALTALLRDTYAAPADTSYWIGLEQRVMTQVQDTRLLQVAYSAPSDATYWNGLEQRVMARVRDNGQMHWWSVLAEWRAAGMVAAAAAIFLVGATTIRQQQSDAVARERARLEAEFSVFDSAAEPVNMAISPTSPNSGRRSTAPERYLDLIRP